ncbi:hypothetical protein ECBP5_0060 [Escherichia phage ECBP5]|uniref:Uncharacterized protein n=1 Tax=Escherichia phage ECBP5 TaxID=1498172 RepID=A0A0F6N5K3_9CAUD|nr:hypothetical protein ECBP5_0060 [Escherichia phage ECBP5]AID17652.1 hypothetical protein ECBP5_0060 [Escherichia phage ECBP5]
MYLQLFYQLKVSLIDCQQLLASLVTCTCQRTSALNKLL